MVAPEKPPPLITSHSVAIRIISALIIPTEDANANLSSLENAFITALSIYELVLIGGTVLGTSG